jgi:DNA-binding transcriptional LysR family regulator
LTSIRQLEAFRAVMLAGSVTRAAELVRLTQPTVSKLIAQLERAMDLKLFERSRGRLIPTPEAEALLHQIDKVFAAVDEVGRNARQLAQGRSGHIRITAIPALGLEFLPRAVASFLEARPDMRVTLNIRASRYVAEWVATQQADLGFVSGTIAAPGTVSEIFQEVSGVCVLPRGHALARKRAIKPADLANERFVSLGRDTAFRYLLDRTFAEASVSRRIIIETNYSASACALVAAGAGVTIVDPISALDRFELGGVVLRPFYPEVKFEASILTPFQASRSLLAQEFLTHLSKLQRDANDRLRKAVGT